MGRLLSLILLGIFSIQSSTINAQNKYAVIVGINDYYKAKNIKSEYSLKGCVNDALGVKTLLLNRFDFEPKNINTLLNQAATQNNLVNALEQILSKSQAGDAVVFYYSGHGTFIDNPALDEDVVKRGYNQSLVMSDLYSKDYECLVRDNILKKLFNKFVAKKVILTSIFDCCFSGGMVKSSYIEEMAYNPYSDKVNEYVNDEATDSLTMKSLPISRLDSPARAFDMNQVLVRTDSEWVPRPAETPNSKFAALAASEDYVRAAEIWDESGIPHGAFTKALLSIYEQSTVDIPLSKIIYKIREEVTKTQLFSQQPQYTYDSSREEANLIGLPLQTALAKPLSVSCISTFGATITLNGGYRTGLAIGNILAGKSGKIIITRIYADSAIARPTSNVLINKDDEFILADPYKTSNPLLKIYIHATSLTTVAFMKSFNKEILPITKQKGYQDYFNWYNNRFSPVFLFTATPGEGKKILVKAMERPFSVQLPIPSDLAGKIKKSLEKEQSIKIVTNRSEADRVLYLNYAVKSASISTPRFVLNYRSAVTNESYDPFKFSKFATSLNSLEITAADASKLTAQIKKITYELARSQGTHWFNTYPKK
ncbi:MAG TPA: caspase family protein [Pedobacter sp.]|nr:caspase family protein [Pedobacter sp.]